MRGERRLSGAEAPRLLYPGTSHKVTWSQSKGGGVSGPAGERSGGDAQTGVVDADRLQRPPWQTSRGGPLLHLMFDCLGL